MNDIARPLKILYVVNSRKYFQSHRRALAEAAMKAGYEVALAAPEDMELPQSDAIKFLPWRLRRGPVRPVSDAQAFFSLRRIIRDLRPDIVHALTLKPTILAGVIARGSRVPAFVVTVPGLGYAFTPGGPGRAVLKGVAVAGYRAALSHPRSHVIFQNASDRSTLGTLAKLPEARSSLIPGSGVDTSRFLPLPLPDGRYTIILPSRLLREKGVADFGHAGRILAAGSARVRLALVGVPDPGNPGSVSEAEIAEWVRRGWVESWGWFDDIRDAFRRAHAVCLPSYYGEGVPKVLLEAAACGRPIVTTDQPGCRDVIDDGGCGIVVPARSPEKLAKAIAKLAGDPVKSGEMALRARARVVEGFDIALVNRATLEVYASLMDRPTNDYARSRGEK